MGGAQDFRCIVKLVAKNVLSNVLWVLKLDYQSRRKRNGSHDQEKVVACEEAVKL